MLSIGIKAPTDDFKNANLIKNLNFYIQKRKL